MKPSEYDQNIGKWIPKYEEMQEVISEILPFKENASIQILELGVGTANLAQRLLRRFLRAHLTGIDHDKEMLKLANQKLQGFSPRRASRETKTSSDIIHDEE